MIKNFYLEYKNISYEGEKRKTNYTTVKVLNKHFTIYE